MAFEPRRATQVGILAAFDPVCGPSSRSPSSLWRPQNATTPCGGNNHLASIRLTSENRLNNCKVPFVSAVSLTLDKEPLRLKRPAVPGFTFRAQCDQSRQNLAPSCTVSSDGLASFNPVTVVGARAERSVGVPVDQHGAWHPEDQCERDLPRL